MKYCKCYKNIHIYVLVILLLKIISENNNLPVMALTIVATVISIKIFKVEYHKKDNP